MYCANSMKGSPKLSKFCFNSVNIPSHKPDNINAFFTISTDEVLDIWGQVRESCHLMKQMIKFHVAVLFYIIIKVY